jgi:hypothetical protein
MESAEQVDGGHRRDRGTTLAATGGVVDPMRTDERCGSAHDAVSRKLRIGWKGDMGITIVQKSDLTVRKRNPRIALVLAGGAISGGGSSSAA